MRIRVVSQTTFSFEKFEKIIKNIRKLCEKTVAVFKTICYPLFFATKTSINYFFLPFFIISANSACILSILSSKISSHFLISSSVTAISVKTKTPIVPIVQFKKLKPFRRRKVFYGEPIEFIDYYDKRLTEEDIKKCDEILLDKMLKMHAQAYWLRQPLKIRRHNLNDCRQKYKDGRHTFGYVNGVCPRMCQKKDG